MKRRHIDLFRKRHFVSVIEQIVHYCTELFGYKKQPYLFESTNRDGELMVIVEGSKRNYAIVYDYQQFKQNFGHLEPKEQEALVAFLAAHEMRHYYQMRQLNASYPKETEETLTKWRENHYFPKPISKNLSAMEFYMQPMELDAQLFAYMFVAYTLNALVKIDALVDPRFLPIMEDYYIELFGKTNEYLFQHDTNS